MPRVRLRPLDSYPFQTRVVVRITDVNYGGHLANDRLLGLLHEVRIRFLAGYGYDEMDCDGVPIIQGDAVIDYQAQGFVGDELLFEVAAGDPTRCSIRFYYRVSRAGDGTVIALAETTMVGFRYEDERIRPLSDAARAMCTVRSRDAGGSVGGADADKGRDRS